VKINVGAFDSLLGRLLSIPQQDGGIAPELAQEISGVFALEVDRPEWCYLKNEKCCAGLINVPGAGGQRAIVRFRNPAAGGMLMVIDAIAASIPTTALVVDWALYIGSAAADFGTVVATKASRDTRLVAADKPAAVLSYDNAGAAPSGTQIELTSSANGAGQLFSPPLILGPGGTCDVVSDANLQQVFVNFHWMERELRAYER